MIYKDSLLDAYMTLNGSAVQHFAYLLTMFLVLGTPDDIKDENLKSSCENIFYLSLVTHFLCFIFKLIVVWNRALSFKPLQVIETTLVILHVYLMLVSIEVFATLQREDVSNGNTLNPNFNHINKGKEDLCHDDLTLIIICINLDSNA